MIRQTIGFAEFEENFIKSSEGGYYPVHAAYAEDNDSNLLQIIELDMICEWRLDDGKVKFLSIPFDNDWQLAKIHAYLELCVDLLSTAIKKNFNKLKVVHI
jgi:hypothetical protein